MRRCALLLLMLVLPVQLIWAAAAPYCGHETGRTPDKHFGHHEHRHQVAGEGVQQAHDDSSALGGSSHLDCESCHLGCSVTLPTPSMQINELLPQALLVPDDAKFASHIPFGPERPDRADHTPAARFAGGVGSFTA